MTVKNIVVPLTITFLFFTAVLAFASEGTFDRNLNVSAAPTLSVSTGAGYIHVYSGSGNQIHIIGRVHVQNSWTEKNNDEVLKQILNAPPITQSGNNITVALRRHDAMFNHISIDYEITAPASTFLTAHTGSGSMEFGGILGSVGASTGSGSIHAENIGSETRLGTGSGSIRASGIKGSAELRSGSGQIEFSSSAPGDVKARSGSGSIHIENAVGSLTASTGSGSITASGNPSSAWRLDSGSGSIRLRLTPKARFDLSARTGSGSLRVNRAITFHGTQNRHHLEGAVNGGGPPLQASTGSGSIVID